MNKFYKEMLKDAEKVSKSIKPLSKKQMVLMLCEICEDLERKDLMRLNKRNLQLLLALMRQ
ncbi:MAG: hypothetical protein CMD86_00620 [Gammaproteobacteria bacterium]|nr:hypothetical protein [Gammaproteobacteria bacterium]|tara:strand:- start:11475 stop:11657 length:183 start_codon:yes stop_codon:yes gene_type:complete